MNHIFSIFHIDLIDISKLINIYNLNLKGINKILNNDYCDNIFADLITPNIDNRGNTLKCILIYELLLYIYTFYIIMYIALVIIFISILICAFKKYFIFAINFIDSNIIIYI